MSFPNNLLTSLVFFVMLLYNIHNCRYTSEAAKTTIKEMERQEASAAVRGLSDCLIAHPPSGIERRISMKRKERCVIMNITILVSAKIEG